MEFISHSSQETQKIAADLAQKIIKTKKGIVIALEGELGAGKTVFVKGFARALGIKSKIKSPTFVLMKKYVVSKSAKSRRRLESHLESQGVALTFYHLDCYRVGGHKDLKIPEIKEMFSEEGGIVLIEWAERISKILPKKHITVHIDHIDKNTRKINIK